MTFTAEEAGWIAQAAATGDTDAAYRVLEARFPNAFRRYAAAQAVDRLSQVREAAGGPAVTLERAQRIREALAAAVRDAGHAPAVDRTQVLESYENGTVLMRDCGAEFTGGVVADRTVYRDHS